MASNRKCLRFLDITACLSQHIVALRSALQTSHGIFLSSVEKAAVQCWSEALHCGSGACVCCVCTPALGVR